MASSVARLQEGGSQISLGGFETEFVPIAGGEVEVGFSIRRWCVIP